MIWYISSSSSTEEVKKTNYFIFYINENLYVFASNYIN